MIKTGIVIAALFGAVTGAQAAEFTPAERAAIAEMAAEVHAGCLKAANDAAALELPPGLPEWAKITLRSQSDPGYCPCVERKFVASITPAFFRLDEQQRQLHALTVMKDMECSVAAVKSRFSQSCPGFVAASLAADPNAPQFDALARRRGLADAGALIDNVCACMRARIDPITPAQWLDRTRNAFAARDGAQLSAAPNQTGKTPLEQALADCMP